MSHNGLVVAIEMLGWGVASNTSAASFNHTLVSIDDGQYDGVDGWYVEVCAINNDSSDRKIYVERSDGTGMTNAEVTIPASTSNYTRIRSSTSWTPTSGENQYRVKIDATTSANDVQAYSVCIIIVQNGTATKTVLPFLMAHNTNGTPTNADGGASAAITSTASTSWGTYSAGTCAYWKKNESVYATLDSWELEAVMSSQGGSYTSRTRLYNETDGSVVGTVECIVASAVSETPILDREVIANSATNFDNADVFRVQQRSGSGLSNAKMYVTRLYVVLTSLSDAEVYYPLIGSVSKIGTVGDSTEAFDETRKLVETGSMPSSEVYFETSGYIDGTTTGLFELMDDGTDDSGTAGLTQLASTTPASHTAANAIKRSSNISSSLTAGNRLLVQVTDYSGGGGSDDTHLLAAHLVYVLGGGLSVTVGDNWGNLADFIDGDGFAQYEQLSVSGSGSMNNWADVLTGPESYDFLTITVSGSLSPLDAFSSGLYGQQGIVASGSLSWQDALSTKTARRFGSDVLIVGEIQQETQTTYISNIGVRHPTRYYAGDVVSFGRIDRSIPVPAGVPRVGDVEITLADTSQTYRKLFSQKTPRKDTILLKLGLEGASESLFQTIYKGEIITADFPPGLVRIRAADITFEWLREQLPSLITKDNFDNLPENTSEIFAPIVFGDVNAVGMTDQGAIKLQQVDTASNYWGGFRHPIAGVTAVYVKNPDDEDFSSASYSVVEVDKTIDGVDYTFTMVRISSAQDGAEVQVDVQGMTDDGTSSGTLSESIADHIKWAMTRLGAGVIESTDQINMGSFDSVKADMDSLSLVFGGAVVSSITYGELIARMLRSSNVDFFQNKDGLITIDYVLDSDANRPEFDDTFKILRESETISLPDPFANKLVYNYQRIYATGEWHKEETYNNTVDQEALGEDVEDTFELWFVRDTTTAGVVIEDLAAYLDLAAYRMSWSLPAPDTIDQVELAKLVGITHYGGLEQAGGGWDNEEFKITSVVFDLDNLRFDIEAIHRIDYGAEVNQLISGAEWAKNLRSGPYPGSTGEFYGVFRSSDDTRMAVIRTQDNGASWVTMDSDGFPSLSNSIQSADSHWNGDYFHVATQETGGRVAYHRFNKSSGTWDIYNEEVVDKVTGIEDYAVSITVKSPSGKPAIYYSSTPEGALELSASDDINNWADAESETLA